MLILKLLASYLTLGVDPDPPDTPDPDPAPQTDPPDDELPDVTQSDPPEDPDAVAPTADQQLAEARTRAERAEREAAELRAAKESAERAARQTSGPSDEQRMFEEEERILRDPAATEMQKWTVNSNRTMRANARLSREAHFAALDTQDRNDFDRLRTTNPALAKRYEKRVEDKLAEIRANGQNLSRRVVLKMLIGDDIVEGKVKTKPKEAPKADTTVPRGTAPSGRSDVRGRGAPASEREKRRARLENQII